VAPGHDDVAAALRASIYLALAQEARRPPVAAPESTILVELNGGKRVLGLTVDEVVDVFATAEHTLERRHALPGVDATLVRAVGRRAGQLFVVLDTDALLSPVLSS